MIFITKDTDSQQLPVRLYWNPLSQGLAPQQWKKENAWRFGKKNFLGTGAGTESMHDQGTGTGRAPGTGIGTEPELEGKPSEIELTLSLFPTLRHMPETTSD